MLDFTKLQRLKGLQAKNLNSISLVALKRADYEFPKVLNLQKLKQAIGQKPVRTMGNNFQADLNHLIDLERIVNMMELSSNAFRIFSSEIKSLAIFLNSALLGIFNSEF